MSVTSAPFYSEPRAVRPFRFLALAALSVVVTGLTALLLLSTFPLLHQAVEPIIGGGSRNDSTLAGWLTMGFIVLVPIALLVVMWRRKLRSWWWVGGGWLVVAPILIYLVVDDATLRVPLTFEDIAPSFPGEDKSFAVLMRYGKNQLAAQTFQPLSAIPGGFPDPIDKPDAWREVLLKNRATFEAEWAALAPQRAWWAELNSFERIGDLTPARPDAEIVSFAVFRGVSQRAWAIASLQALDGHGDAAIDTLLPIIQVGRKLQPSAHTLVRQMIGVVIEKSSMRMAMWILDHATVSPAARARLAAALQGGAGEAGARALVTVDYVMSVGTITDRPLGDLVGLVNTKTAFRVPLNLVSPFVYNRRATANLYGTHVLEMQDLAARRDLKTLVARQEEFIRRDARPRFKNFMGALVVHEVIPAYTKVLESYWKTADMRAALLERLAKPQPSPL